ncbi:MAG: KH domain-containing protein, partial [Bacilli bacterium]|nr:KH domain-containing protein [Bacilli bacterium]
MKIEVFEGKDEQEVLERALNELNTSEEETLHFVTKEKVGLLKKEVVSVHIAKLEDVAVYIKEYLNDIVTDMGLEVSFETKIREQQITVKMYSNNNKILIGKNGQTLQALTTVVKQKIYNELGQYPYLILDVENYKEKQVKYLERLAKNVAREVAKTKVEVELENMNSYERRIVHNALTGMPHIKTESSGFGK